MKIDNFKNHLISVVNSFTKKEKRQPTEQKIALNALTVVTKTLRRANATNRKKRSVSDQNPADENTEKIAGISNKIPKFPLK